MPSFLILVPFCCLQARLSMDEQLSVIQLEALEELLNARAASLAELAAEEKLLRSVRHTSTDARGPHAASAAPFGQTRELRHDVLRYIAQRGSSVLTHARAPDAATSRRDTSDRDAVIAAIDSEIAATGAEAQRSQRRTSAPPATTRTLGLRPGTSKDAEMPMCCCGECLQLWGRAMAPLMTLPVSLRSPTDKDAPLEAAILRLLHRRRQLHAALQDEARLLVGSTLSAGAIALLTAEFCQAAPLRPVRDVLDPVAACHNVAACLQWLTQFSDRLVVTGDEAADRFRWIAQLAPLASLAL
jgi:hypothetical protein